MWVFCVDFSWKSVILHAIYACVSAAMPVAWTVVLDWIRSYSSNRKQYVEYNGHHSLRNEISCGVPQGSILGLLFFLLFINDINNASNLLNLILFADDTNVFMAHKDLNYLSDMLNLEMDKLSIWFKANKLSLNLKKTKFMVFKPRQKHSICNIQISIDNQNIVKVKDTNFLGVILDESLNWKSEISHIANKVAKIQTGGSFHLIVIYFWNSKTIPQLNFERILVTDFCSNYFSVISPAYLLYQ